MPLRKFSLPISQIREKAGDSIYEMNGVEYINITIIDLYEPDAYGKNFTVQLDLPKEEWEKPYDQREPKILCKGKFIYTKREKEAMGLADTSPAQSQQTFTPSDVNEDTELPF